MNDVDTSDLAALSLHLRNKTPLGRLNDAEVRDVLAHLAELGMVFAPSAPAEYIPEPATAIDTAIDTAIVTAIDTTIVVPPPVEVAPVIAPPPEA